jgi:hypothetical protein
MRVAVTDGHDERFASGHDECEAVLWLRDSPSAAGPPSGQRLATILRVSTAISMKRPL